MSPDRKVFYVNKYIDENNNHLSVEEVQFIIILTVSKNTAVSYANDNMMINNNIIYNIQYMVMLE